MVRTFYLFVALLLTSIILAGCASASPAVTPAPDAILRALAKYFGKESLEEASEQIAALGGRELFERAAKKVGQSGNEALIERVSLMTLKHGPDVLRAIDNLPPKSTSRVISALKEIPVENIPQATKRLSSGRQGKEIASSVVEYGSDALKTELAHPGLGPKLIRSFGNEGVDVVITLSNDRAISLARHADEIAALPAQQRDGIRKLITKYPDDFFKWLGKVVRENPGKTIFSMAGTVVLIADADNIFGKDGTRTNPDGSTEPVRVPGAIDPLVNAGSDAVKNGTETITKPVSRLFDWLVGIAVAFVAILAVTKIWSFVRMNQITIRDTEAEMQSKSHASD